MLCNVYYILNILYISINEVINSLRINIAVVQHFIRDFFSSINLHYRILLFKIVTMEENCKNSISTFLLLLLLVTPRSYDSFHIFMIFYIVNTLWLRACFVSNI